MNIWIVNHYAITPDRAGGTRHFTLARELGKRGHKVTVIASSFDHTTRRELHLQGGERYKLDDIEGVRFLWLRTPPYGGNGPRRLWNMAAFAREVVRVDKRLVGDLPDVVLGSSPHLFAAWAAEKLARRHGAHFVMEVRDIWPQSLVDLGNISEKHPLILALAAIEKHLYRRAGRIITLLPGANMHIVAKGGDAEKLAWIPNGVDLGVLPQPVPPVDRDTFTLMYAGTHGLANGLQVLLEAAKKLSEESTSVRIRLVGDGPDKKRLQELALKLGLDNVSFEPPVPKAQIYDKLNEADAFLMVLQDSPVFRWGVSPNKLFDYMAASRPIVFSVNTPLNPVAEAGAGVTVPAGDPNALAEAISSMALLPPEERWEMGLRGRKYVEENHSLAGLADKLEAVLMDVREA